MRQNVADDIKPFTHQLFIIQKSTGNFCRLTGWKDYENVSEIWLPIGIRSPEQWHEILKQHGGDRWQATSEYKSVAVDVAAETAPAAKDDSVTNATSRTACEIRYPTCPVCKKTWELEVGKEYSAPGNPGLTYLPVMTQRGRATCPKCTFDPKYRSSGRDTVNSLVARQREKKH